MSSRLNPNVELGQVVGAEGEEFAGLRHTVGEERGARDFDHCAVLVIQLGEFELFEDLVMDAVCELLGDLDLGDVAGHRDHDLRDARLAGLGQFGGALEDGPDLHLAHFGIGDAEADTPVTHHRVGLMERFAPLLDILHIDAQRPGQLGLLLGALGYEFVQRRVKEADRHRQAFHGFQRALQRGLDEGEEFVQSRSAFPGGIAEDHLAEVEEGLIRALTVEHVLRPEQSDPFGTEHSRHPGVLGRVGVGSDTHRAERVGHRHEPLEARILGRVHHRQGAHVDVALGSVQGDDVPFLENDIRAGDPGRLYFTVDVETPRADDAALAPAAGNERRMGGHAAARGEDAAGRAHPFDVLGVRLFTKQDAFLAGAVGGHGIFGGKDQGSAGGARTGGKTLDEQAGVFFRLRIDDRIEEFFELFGCDAHDGGLFVDEPFVEHVDGHVEGGGAGPFADAALEHPQFPLLDGELDVEHVGEVFLQLGADGIQFPVGSGHGVLHAHEVLVLLVLGVVVDRAGGTDTRYDVFTLGIHEPFAVEFVVARGRVASESDAGG